jgi:integrase
MVCLAAGIPIATVAELMGHTTTAMVMRYYSKLQARRSHLRDAVESFRGAGDQPREP